MDGLVAQCAQTERDRLHVLRVDADERPRLAERLDVEDVPTLVLLKDRVALGRIDGRATGAEIRAMIDACCTS
jgi:thioredoxin-like negative regulator of GroEL